MYPSYSPMSAEDRYGLRVKQFALFFLGVGVGVFLTIILFIYGCCSGSCISTPKSAPSATPTDASTDNPPAYSSLRFDRKGHRLPI